MDQPAILLVEDDDAVGGPLRRALDNQGFEVKWAKTGAEALDSLSEVSPDLILLDLGLPDVEGVELCRVLRNSVPSCVIVMLTARSEEVDIVIGLDAGADDYLVKPFRLAELSARIRAHLRRLQPATDASCIENGALHIDTAARRAWIGENELALRNKEFDLLTLLVSESGRAVERDRIMHDLWDENWFGSTKTLDMHICWLRRKLTDAGGDAAWITTLRGVGYRFERVRDPLGS